MVGLATPDDVRSSLSDRTTREVARLFRNVDDDALQVKLDAASRKVEGLAHSTLVAGAWTETVELNRDPDSPPFAIAGWVGWVSRYPMLRDEMWVGALTGITTLSATYSTTTLDITKAQFTPSSGRIRLPWSSTLAYYSGAVSVEVTYAGGFGRDGDHPVPEDLVEATILVAADTFIAGIEAPSSTTDPEDLWARIITLLKPWQDAVPPGIR